MTPISDNPLLSRDDVHAAMMALYAPLAACASPGGARYDLEAHASTADGAAMALEGFTRPLIGLAAAAAGGYPLPARDLVLWGLTSGTDPDHPEYWGQPRDRDQRLVEAAAIATALLIAPDAFWWPLTPRARDNLSAWLTAARDAEHFDNNWLGMRALTDLSLTVLEWRGDAAARGAWRDRIEQFHLGDGWFSDGTAPRVDHYNGFGIHFDALLLAALDEADPGRAARARERAAAFAPGFAHWFAADGAALPFGRSLSYRFGCAAFWGALAFAEVDALPWGEIKGHWLRHLRWWARQRFTRRDGLLSLGHAYPNAAFAEDYLSPGSPCWAFRAFLPLALAPDHPFWLADEIPPERPRTPVTLPAPGMIVSHRPEQSIALVSGQRNPHIRDGAEKYSKFAYSTRHGFCIEPHHRHADWAAVDNMIGFMVDGQDLRVRTGCVEAGIGDNLIHSRWHPYDDVTVETWLWWADDWHIRLHRIEAARPMATIEGGFAVALPGDDAPARLGRRDAWVRSGSDVSAIADIGPVQRQARLQRVVPNSSLIHPRAIVPQLKGRIPAGTSILATAVHAGAETVPPIPSLPDEAALARLTARALTTIAPRARPAG